MESPVCVFDWIRTRRAPSLHCFQFGEHPREYTLHSFISLMPVTCERDNNPPSSQNGRFCVESPPLCSYPTKSTAPSVDSRLCLSALNNGVTCLRIRGLLLHFGTTPGIKKNCVTINPPSSQIGRFWMCSFSPSL